MTLEQIRQALVRLTLMRSRIDNNLMAGIRQTLQPEQEPRPTYDQLLQAERELDERIPGFYIIWDKVNMIYGLIPDEE